MKLIGHDPPPVILCQSTTNAVVAGDDRVSEGPVPVDYGYSVQPTGNPMRCSTKRGFRRGSLDCSWREVGPDGEELGPLLPLGWTWRLTAGHLPGQEAVRWYRRVRIDRGVLDVAGRRRHPDRLLGQ